MRGYKIAPNKRHDSRVPHVSIMTRNRIYLNATLMRRVFGGCDHVEAVWNSDEKKLRLNPVRDGENRWLYTILREQVSDAGQFKAVAMIKKLGLGGRIPIKLPARWNEFEGVVEVDLGGVLK